jgi:hypothetical protein
LRLTARAGVDVVPSLEQVAKDGQELGFLQLLQPNAQAAKVGI